jgi:hypothetical protein
MSDPAPDDDDDDAEFTRCAAIPMEWQPSVTPAEIKLYCDKIATQDRTWMIATLCVAGMTPAQAMSFFKADDEPMAFLEGLIDFKTRHEEQQKIIEAAVARLLIVAHHAAAEVEV